jgi:ATP-dependent RNA helicase DeaD
MSDPDPSISDPVSPEPASPEQESSEPTFSDLGLDPRILAALSDLGFEKPTPIQAEAIPPLRDGHDIVARARTGSGKTAAFGLPLLERVKDSGKGVKALVLAPTRELASQVSEALETFATKMPLKTVTIYGGASYRPQLVALKKGVPIVVGTPGRLIDHLESGALDLSGLELIVLDEADEMLRMGFIDAVEQILAATPDTRQVALFSATMPPAIRRVADRYLKDPITVEADVARGTTVDHVRQRIVLVPQRFKAPALMRYLKGEDRGATLVFSRTRAGCGEIAGFLADNGIEAEALHGDLAQKERERVLGRLRSGRIGVVVATDVAARGIDVEGITHVVNLDLPDNPESYTHRIGRTGRAGREGTALTFITPRERGRVNFFRNKLGATFEDYVLPTDAAIARRERDVLVKSLEGAGEAAKGWVEHMVEEGQTAEDIAAAALEMLAKSQRVSLRTDLPDVLPDWARPQHDRGQRHDRGNYQDRGQRQDRGNFQDRGPRHNQGNFQDRGPRHNQGNFQDRGPRPNQGNFQNRGPGPGPFPDQRDPQERGPRQNLDEVELFIGAGRQLGVRPGDLVGALAGDSGISGSDIGRIQVGERSSFVGVSRETARRVLDGRHSLNVRGRDVKLSLAHPGGKPTGPERPYKQRGPGKPPGTGPKPHRKGPRRVASPGPGGHKPWKGSGGKR